MFRLIRINRERCYTDAELREISEFNHRLVERTLPELKELMDAFEAKPRNVVIFELPADMAEKYEVLVKRYC